MKKFLFSTIILAFISFQAQAQFVLVNSPDELAGSYVFETAALFGRVVTDSIWTEDVALIDDGTALPNEGCEAAINGADVAGKIALVDRGNCSFVLKAQNAQAAGAVAVVILNHTAGAGVIPMGGEATDVNIPVVMLSFEDGQAIKAALADGITVNMTIGDIRFPNDVGTTEGKIINAPQGTVASLQLENETTLQQIVTPGASVTNRGTNEATGINLTATINHTFDGTTTEVYQETGTLDVSLMTDSSGTIVLPEYDPAPAGLGVYEITYEVGSAVEDDILDDNVVTTSFSVVDNAVSKARWDFDTNRPISTAGRTAAGGGAIEFLSPFHFPNGVGYKMDSVVVQVSKNSPETLASEVIEAFVYDWIDANEDGAIGNDEIEVVALGVYEFDGASTVSSTMISIPLIDFETLEDPGFIIPEDDKNYIVGARYSGANLLFFGFDDGYDMTEYLNLPSADNELHLPYIGTNTWNDLLPDIESGFTFTGSLTSVSTGLYLSVVSSNKNILEDEVAISLYPNPVSNELVSEVTLEEKANQVEYQILDVNGRVVYRVQQENVTTQQQTFDVSRLPAGQYFFNVLLEQGTKSLPFVIQR